MKASDITEADYGRQVLYLPLRDVGELLKVSGLFCLVRFDHGLAQVLPEDLEFYKPPTRQRYDR